MATYVMSFSQSNSTNPKIKLDTIVYLGEKENWNAQFFFREMRYDFFDSAVYYCHNSNIKPDKITIPYYDFKSFRTGS